MVVKFKDCGKKIKDLLGKRFDFDYSLDTKNKSKDGYTMTCGFALENPKAESKGELSGFTKMEYEDPSFGEVEVNMKVNGEKEDENTSLSCKLDKLADGLELNIACNVIPEVELTADYNKDSLAAQAKLTSDMKFSNTALSANGAFTYNNFSLGVSGEFDLIGQEPKNYDAALQFTQKPHIVSLATKKQFSKFLVGYYTTPQDDLAVGAQVQITKDSDAPPVGNFGFDWKINPTMSLKAKVDTLKTFTYSVEHQLSNPALKVCFAHELKPCSESMAATNWGFGVTLGDY